MLEAFSNEVSFLIESSARVQVRETLDGCVPEMPMRCVGGDSGVEGGVVHPNKIKILLAIQ